MKKITILTLFTCLSWLAWGQRGEVKTLPLDDLSSFRPQAGNWRIVGDVYMNPSVNSHTPPAPAPVAEAPAKGKKGKKTATPATVAPTAPQAVFPTDGKGILLNMNTETVKDHLVTAWEHGDIELEFEVMMPKGSNSGVYLQGRYEVQLLDSWGVKQPAYSDIGGIYRNWENTPGKIYMGKAPLTNAAKAPGLWQHFKISFQAPRFDAAGNKIANARFVSVDLNGVRIHENVEVPLPTGGPIANSEVAYGPIMIQGDHGPVAIRNLKYRLLNEKTVTLSNLSYQIYKDSQENYEAFVGKPNPTMSGELSQLTMNIPGIPSTFGLVIKGQMNMEEAGPYHFRFDYAAGGGDARIKIGDQVFSGEYSNYDQEVISVNMPKGATPFEIHFYRNSSWGGGMLELYNFGSFPKPLHAYNSVMPRDEPANNQAIFVNVGSKPRLLRAFLDFAGDPKQRLTHTIGVGGTQGTHYIYDLKAGNLACAWRGDFVDATPMWDGRGDGSFRPVGAVEYLFAGASFALLDTLTGEFPKALDDAQGFRNLGYRVDETSGEPVFQYKDAYLALEDHFRPEGAALVREITLSQVPVGKKLYVKVAEGKQIRQVGNGAYSIDGRYYIQPQGNAAFSIRTVSGKQELIARPSTEKLAYSFIW